jgi:hypothetical protein
MTSLSHRCIAARALFQTGRNKGAYSLKSFSSLGGIITGISGMSAIGSLGAKKYEKGA